VAAPPTSSGLRAVAGFQDDVDDALVGREAVLERRFLGQDVDPQDRLSGQVADLVEAGDPAPVDEDRRALAAAAAVASDLGSQLVQQLGDAADAVAGHVLRLQLQVRLDVADHLAGLDPLLGGDHYLGDRAGLGR